MNKGIVLLALLAFCGCTTQNIRGQGPLNIVLYELEDSSFVEDQSTKRVEKQDVQTVTQSEVLTDQSADVFLIDEKGIPQMVGRAGNEQVKSKMFQQYVKELLKLEQQNRVQEIVVSHVAEQPQQQQVDAAPVVIHDDSMTQPDEAASAQPTLQSIDKIEGTFISNLREIKFLTTFEKVVPHKNEWIDKKVTLEELKESDCFYLFNKCDYSGFHLKSCSKAPILLSDFPHPVHSLYVPHGGQLSLEYQLQDGLQRSFIDSINCLDTPITLAIDPASMTQIFKDGTIISD